MSIGFNGGPHYVSDTQAKRIIDALGLQKSTTTDHLAGHVVRLAFCCYHPTHWIIVGRHVGFDTDPQAMEDDGYFAIVFPRDGGIEEFEDFYKLLLSASYGVSRDITLTPIYVQPGP